MKNVCVIGHFAEGLNLLNGQTVKTKVVYDELVGYLGNERVETVDTHGGVKTLIRSIGKYYRVFKNCSDIMMLPAENGLRVLSPIFVFLNLFYGRKIHYIVIGGWLPEFLSNKPILKRILKSFHKIYVETKNMQLALEKLGIDNVLVMPNFKNIEINKTPSAYQPGESLKLCTFSRVMKEKGIEDAVEAVRLINEKQSRSVYSLDIYGQIEEKQMAWFENLQSKFPEEVRYCGVVAYDRSTQVLKDYFALLFPTFYDGEGFAGTLIDALAAGVPIIATDWKYNSEIVDEKTGILIQPHNRIELVSILSDIKENMGEWNLKRVNCTEKAKQYLPENALKVLMNEVKQ